MDWTFDARTVQPQQGGGAHPVGNKFPFTITNVEVKATKENTGGMLNVELTSPAGSVINRYNLWNENDKAREIAQKELSALCHVTGIFVIGPRQGQELLGGKGLMDIGFQRGHEPTAEKPAGGYVEVKKVYDMAGNEPGKAVQQQPQQSGVAVQSGGFNPNPANQPANNPSWNANAGQAANQQVSQNAGGWSQGQAATTAPWKQ
jgi:hypothetical protein